MPNALAEMAGTEAPASWAAGRTSIGEATRAAAAMVLRRRAKRFIHAPRGKRSCPHQRNKHRKVTCVLEVLLIICVAGHDVHPPNGYSRPVRVDMSESTGPWR